MAADLAGNVYVADVGNGVARVVRPTGRSTLIGVVADAANGSADAVSPGKIVVIYGRMVKIFKLAFRWEVRPLPLPAFRLVFRPILTHTERPEGRQ